MINPDGAFLVGSYKNDFGQDYTEEVVRDMFRVPTPTRANSMDLLRMQLLKLPLDALRSFDELIPEKPSGAFDTVPKAVDTIIKALANNPVYLTWQKFLEFLEQLKKDPGAVIGKIGKDMVDGLQTALDNLVKLVREVIENIWKGVGGLGEVVGGIFDPDKARKAMEAIQVRIAAAIGQIAAQGGTVEMFGEYPPGVNLGGRWFKSRVGGASGNIGIREGLLRIVDDVGLGGSRWRVVYLDKSSNGPDMRVDAVFATAPGLLSNAENRILAKCSDSGTEHAYANLMNGKYTLGIWINGREATLKSGGLKFSPTYTYSVVCKGSTMEFWENSRLVASVVDQRISQLTGRRMGYETFEPLSIDRAGGLAAIGFRSFVQTLKSEDKWMAISQAATLAAAAGLTLEQATLFLQAQEQLQEGPVLGTVMVERLSGDTAIRVPDVPGGVPVWTIIPADGSQTYEHRPPALPEGEWLELTP